MNYYEIKDYNIYENLVKTEDIKMKDFLKMKDLSLVMNKNYTYVDTYKGYKIWFRCYPYLLEQRAFICNLYYGDNKDIIYIKELGYENSKIIYSDDVPFSKNHYEKIWNEYLDLKRKLYMLKTDNPQNNEN